MVEDAERTYSPISVSADKTVLLSSPSSFASSWTRGLATNLLMCPDRVWAGHMVRVLIADDSSLAHELLPNLYCHGTVALTDHRIV